MHQPNNQSDNQLADIQEKAASLTKIIQTLKADPDLYDVTCRRWEQICRDIPEQVESGTIKVAVVGAVKSGKSTFINSIFQTDFLKRGAGVVTSVVTKIRKGKNLKAQLTIKSWDEINRAIEEALLSFENDCLSEKAQFDLRRKSDRKCLQQIYDQLSSDASFNNNQVKPETILINNVLNNYEFCKTFVKPDEFMFEMKNEDFYKHKEFTGDPSRAFFIKDAKLEVNFGNIGSFIEIADCQGIDSTDTAQLSLVLEYLEASNMIIYLISSRTGLRKADMRLLSIIFKMGIGDNVVFIVNCDLNEHESLRDLAVVEDKIRQDLDYFRQNLNFYSFSSLYNLYSKNLSDISTKEEQQIKVWETDTDIIHYSRDMTDKFFSCFEKKIKNDRQKLIFSNPSTQLVNVTTGLKNKVKLFSDTFLNDSVISNDIIKELRDTQTSIDRLQALVKNSRQIIFKDLKEKVDTQIENHFVTNDDSVINRINSFIENYVVGFNRFEKQIFTIGFPKALFLIFQDFRIGFDRFLMEKIDPELRKFVRDQEKALDNQAASLYGSYKEDISNLYRKFGDMETGLHSISDLFFIRQNLGINTPSMVLMTRYNSRIKIGSFAGLGVFSLFLLVMKRVGKEPRFAKTSVLKKASLSFKKEVFRSIKIQINEYKQKIEKDYFHLLVQALSREINDIIIDQLRIYSVNIDNVESKLKREETEKIKQKEFLDLITKELEVLS
jgi:Dynamin family